MKNQLLEVERGRFLLNDPRRYQIRGVIPEGFGVEAFLDGERLAVSLEYPTAKSAVERYKDSELGESRRVEATVVLPETLTDCRKLEVYAVSGEKKLAWFRMKGTELRRIQGKPQYFIEEERISRAEHTLVIRGWAAAPGHVQIRFYDENKKTLDVPVQRNVRMDVQDMFGECVIDPESGFYAEIEEIHGKYMYLVMRGEDGNKSVCRIGLGAKEAFLGKAEKYRKKGMYYLRAYGVKALGKKVLGKVSQMKNRPMDYSQWLPKHLPSKEELEKQRKTVFPYMPKISLVVPLYKTKEEYLCQMVSSVKNQTYPNWELCLSDGSGPDSPLTGILKKFAKEDSRIRVIFHEEPLRIAQNTNEAIKEASGDFIAFADHDDVLCEHALFECVKVLNEKPDTQVIYSDEDKMSIKGNKFFEPHFKPDFNLDLLCTVNYICHLFVVRSDLAAKAGLLRPEYDGAQDYDFIFRCVEETSKICHIPKILYHWRCHEDSTSENPESKMYAFDAGQRAVQAHFDRMGIGAEVYKGEYLGLYRTHYIRGYDPLISIIIPNKDHTEDLERCISSIEKKSTYRNFEYIIVENNSTSEETFAYYKKLEKENPRVHMAYWDGPFNYSAINNFGASFAKGEYLLLLNNDTEVINPDWLEELLGYCMRPDVGIVGARLYYEDETIQHAGVVLGFGGIAGHCFVQQPRGNTGYCHRIICAQNYSAVTAACMMVKKKAFDEVSGLSTDLAVAFNDIDFCLKVQAAGYLVVYNPYAELYHYESKSRGLEDTPEKKERFAREIATLEGHWPEIFSRPDPYYNPNLTLKSQDFSLKRL